MASAVSAMDEEQKKIRKGTKSCTECRRRKIRCIYTASDQICQHCTSRKLACVPQLYHVKQARREISSRDRISKLERQIANLVAASHASPSHDSDEYSSDTTEAPDVETVPPSHLRLLFDNAAVAEEPYRSRPAGHRAALDRLQALIPCKDDVKTIASSASQWILLYHTFFPTSTLVGTPDDLLRDYDTFTSQHADPIRVSAFLLSLAMTVLQLSISHVNLALQSMKAPAVFVRRVTKVVSLSVLADNDLAATYEGIELQVFHLRLLLAMGRVRDIFLMLRRTIALAEYLGLHKIPHSASTRRVGDRRTDLLKVVTATDRMASMMFNLPPATINYKLPPEDIIEATGAVSVHAYMMELSGIALKVQSIDDDLALGRPYYEVHQTVISTDTMLRALACRTPPQWWDDSEITFDPKYLAQSFHWYLTVRVHLHSAMQGDPHDQYAYSRSICIEACQKSARRILFLRQILPAGFFLLRLLQMQLFTIAIVALLSHRQQEQILFTFDQRMLLVTSIVESFEDDLRKRSGNANFAAEAATALKTLQGWLRTPDSLAAESLTLRVPMLGKVMIGQAHRRRTARDTSQAASDPAVGPTNVVWDQSWMLELDMNTIYDEAFLTSGMGDLEQYWPMQDDLSSGVPT